MLTLIKKKKPVSIFTPNVFVNEEKFSVTSHYFIHNVYLRLRMLMAIIFEKYQSQSSFRAALYFRSSRTTIHFHYRNYLSLRSLHTIVTRCNV